MKSQSFAQDSRYGFLRLGPFVEQDQAVHSTVLDKGKPRGEISAATLCHGNYDHSALRHETRIMREFTRGQRKRHVDPAEQDIIACLRV